MELYPTKFNKDLKGRNLDFVVGICAAIYQKVYYIISYICKKHLFLAFPGIINALAK